MVQKRDLEGYDRLRCLVEVDKFLKAIFVI